MNKIIPTTERVFMALVGPSGCGKSFFIYQMLKNRVFFPSFDKILYFYQFEQALYVRMRREIANIEFIPTIDFELMEKLENDGTNYLLIFDDSCDEICRSKQFEKLATAGRHRKLNCIYIKHNLFHKSPIGRDVELQNTHIVLFKSPRDVHQINVLGKQLGLDNSQLTYWYNQATSSPFGHLMIDLSPRTNDLLRFSSDSSSFPATFYLPSSRARITQIDDRSTELLYSQALSFLQTNKDNFP